MGSAFHQLRPRYSGTLTPTAPTAIRLRDTFTFTYMEVCEIYIYIYVKQMKNKMLTVDFVSHDFFYFI